MKEMSHISEMSSTPAQAYQIIHDSEDEDSHCE